MGKLGTGFKRALEKVNVQVSLLTCALVIFSSLIIFLVTSGIMLSILTDVYDERSDLTFGTLESHLDDSIFRDDISESAYMAEMSYLAMVKDNMKVSELYIFKKGYSDSIERVLDTDDAGKADFEHNRIETGQIEEKVENIYQIGYARAGDFIYTDKGYRYMRFYPVSAGSRNVKGVVGVSIDVQKIWTIKTILHILIAIIILLCCLISIRFSKRIFRKISNPLYQDSSNTDTLTGLKNKNSYTVDLHNIEMMNTERYGAITADLNGLKEINDTRGHQAGDLYIQCAAKILRDSLEGTGCIAYRVGGDEFTVFAKDKTLEEIKQIVEKIEETAAKNREQSGSTLTMSIGYAKFDSKMDRNFAKTIERSDNMMYENKRMFYQKKNRNIR